MNDFITPKVLYTKWVVWKHHNKMELLNKNINTSLTLLEPSTFKPTYLVNFGETVFLLPHISSIEHQQQFLMTSHPMKCYTRLKHPTLILEYSFVFVMLILLKETVQNLIQEPCVLDIPMVWKRINYIISKLILPLFHGMYLFMKPYFFFIILNSWNFSLAPLILLIMINSYYQLNHISQLILHSQFPLICIFGLYHCLIIFPTNITCSKWRSHFIRSTWGYFIWFQFIWTTISTTCHSFPQVR